MNTSQTSSLSKPAGSTKVPLGTLAYLRARNKRRAYDLVIKEFKNSGISQADLARRLGKGTDYICKLLGGPGNWTLDTISDLLFALSSAEPRYSLDYPLDKPARNFRGPTWLNDEPDWVKKLQASPPKQPPVAPPPSGHPFLGRAIEPNKPVPLPKELVGA
jgi:hypothetical protein